MKNSTGTQRMLLAPDDQPVSFAELFFDLVFVFSITQVVHLFHGSFDWVHFGRAILVFWLVWWAWTQYTWALNAADTTHGWIMLATILATVFAFFMAVSVPQSFSTHAWWFGASYVAVRSIGLLIYLWVSWPDERMRRVVILFSIVSVAGLVSALAGGFMHGAWQYGLWGLTILLDIVAAGIGGSNEGWNLHPKHFTERHGLFVIIALGESLIIAASGITDEHWDMNVTIAAMLAVGISACFWWLYFSQAKNQMEHTLARQTGSIQSRMARDAFSLLHFPLICGLITLAFAMEESLKEPGLVMTNQTQAALSISIFLFSSGLAISLWRMTGHLSWIRIIGSILLSLACMLLQGITTIPILALAFAGLVIYCFLVEMFEKNETPNHG